MWTAAQDQALLEISRWFKNEAKHNPIFRLFGYAGTGKTTLARHIAETLGVKASFAAFSGKAAHVLSQKGCPAKTIHSLIYRPIKRSSKYLAELKDKIEQETNKEEKEKLTKKLLDASKKHRAPLFEFSPNECLDDVKLLIIDECSMVGERMGKDLVSLGIPILVLGDPGQLPPIGDAGFFTNQKPNILLTEIHRQARDNPIIHLATLARTGQSITTGDYGSGVVVKSRKEIDAKEVLSMDQILVGKNETRRLWNGRIRQLKFNTQNPLPIVGEKLICLRNSKSGLLNGSIWEILSEPIYFDDNSDLLIADITSPDAAHSDVQMYTKIFKNQEISFYERYETVEEFDYGYAITVHKSQGSQWDKVMLLNESGSFRKMQNNWLYTGITRAAEELTILL